jgi:hypothetical protein
LPKFNSRAATASGLQSLYYARGARTFLPWPVRAGKKVNNIHRRIHRNGLPLQRRNAMRKKIIGMLATSVALSALLVATDASAGNRGGGRGGGGSHGFAGRSGGHGLGGHHFSGRSFAGHSHRLGTAHGLTSHSLATHGLATHGLATHSLTTHGLSSPSQIGGANGSQFGTQGRLAHNQLAGAQFHGLQNFNSTGFNRNAFGDRHAWNRWGGRFWGAGWNNWGWGWGGWAGPVFWPFLYGDIFTFAFWPYGYYDPFWALGPNFLLASIFAPGPYFGYDYGYGAGYYGYAGSPDIYYGRHGARGSRQERAQAEAAAQSCSGLAPGVTDLPIEQIRRKIHPTGDAAAALDGLSAAAFKASDVVQASCPTEAPLTPMARLDAAEKRLEAMLQAVAIMRDPLAKFYDALGEEQKQRFDALGSAGTTRAGWAPGGGDQASLCGQQDGVTNLPVQRIERVVAPNADQQGAFDDLKKAAKDAADQLQASCPTQVPQTPVARLDAVDKRLNAMVDAMNVVRPKLAAFYAALNDQQKAKFNTMGPPQSVSSQSGAQ